MSLDKCITNQEYPALKCMRGIFVFSCIVNVNILVNVKKIKDLNLQIRSRAIISVQRLEDLMVPRFC